MHYLQSIHKVFTNSSVKKMFILQHLDKTYLENLSLYLIIFIIQFTFKLSSLLAQTALTYSITSKDIVLFCFLVLS